MFSVDIVAVIAILQYIAFGVLVGRARATYGVKAPAISGHEQFERVHRVHMNTLESLVAFLPVLYLAARYWPAWGVSGVGAVYVIGRIVYWQAYVKNPAGRGLGFLLSMGPVLLLALAALVGAVRGSLVA